MKLEYKPETNIRYDSMTGEKKQETSHLIYADKDFLLALNASRKTVKEDAQQIVKAVNMHNELIELLECYEGIDDIESQHKFSDKVRKMLEKAEGATNE